MEDSKLHASHIYSYFTSLQKLGMSKKQKAYYSALQRRVKLVSISTIDELPEQIRQYIANLANIVNPQLKQCYRNSQLFVFHSEYNKPRGLSIRYVEGYMTIFGLPIDHAFNSITFRGITYYIDITTLAKGFPQHDNTEYSMVASYNSKSITEKLLKFKYYNRWIDKEISDKIFK